MSGIKDYSTTPSNNNAAPPNGFPEGMAPASLNDGMRQVMADIRSWYQDPAWINLGDAPTYSSGTVFLLSGDKTATYTVGMRIKASGTTPFTIYGTISVSSYSAPNTSITVVWDSGSMNSTLNAVSINLSQDAIEKLDISTATITTLTSTTANITTLNATTISGAGSIAVAGTSSSPAFITLAEDTDNGTNKATLIAPASIASDYTVTLPSAAGTLVTATDVTTLFNGCKVYQTTGTSVTIGTWTTLLFDTESWDDDGWHSTSVNTGRITFNFTGRVTIIGNYAPNTPNNSSFGVRILKNGSVIGRVFYRTSDPAAENLQASVSCEIDVVSTDYIELQGYNSNGTVVSGTGLGGTTFSARRIR